MGMSTGVVGFKPPDAKWRKMKAAYDACSAAGVDPPPSVMEFFGGDSPDDAGVEVDRKALEECGAVVPYSANMQEGYEVYVDKLPKDVKVVRFYNSW
jgi:hypothetical protein